MLAEEAAVKLMAAPVEPRLIFCAAGVAPPDTALKESELGFGMMVGAAAAPVFAPATLIKHTSAKHMPSPSAPRCHMPPHLCARTVS